MTRPTLSTSDLAALGFSGELLQPGDASYEEVRHPWNGMFDPHPALIARCRRAGDVAAAVRVGVAGGLPIAVRSGGHSIPGFSSGDDGLLIDLRPMNAVDVDPEGGIARVGGGTLWGEIDAATQEYGLHTPGGRVTTTGVGGFTTGGGYGWTSTRYGLACDNVVSAQVVTAAGDVLETSPAEHPDLFWGIRGGGGNFGVVTRFDFRLHPLGPLVLAGLALWPLARAAEVLRGWRDHAERAGGELSTAAVLITAPPEPFVPEHLRGQPALAIPALYVGEPDRGAEHVGPIRELAPDADLIQPTPYLDFQAMLDPTSPPGMRNYTRGEYVDELSDAAIDRFVEHGERQVRLSPMSQIIMFRVGGAIAEVGEDDTAVSSRAAAYLFHPISAWHDPALDREAIAANREMCAAIAEFTTGGVYVNFTAEQEAGAAYRDAKRDRLRALKRSYDPENVFRRNQNIAP